LNIKKTTRYDVGNPGPGLGPCMLFFWLKVCLILLNDVQ
jgi:hypothetical protein